MNPKTNLIPPWCWAMSALLCLVMGVVASWVYFRNFDAQDIVRLNGRPEVSPGSVITGQRVILTVEGVKGVGGESATRSTYIECAGVWKLLTTERLAGISPGPFIVRLPVIVPNGMTLAGLVPGPCTVRLEITYEDVNWTGAVRHVSIASGPFEVVH